MTNPTDLIRYDGLRVVVTGAASGMGEATAGLLGELGAEVHTLDVRPVSVACAAFHQADLSDRSSIDRAAAAIAAVGPIDRLFNCAGIAQVYPPMQQLLVNFVGMRLLTELLIPSMVDGGAIASISSGAGMGYLGTLATCQELIATRGFDEAKHWCEEHPAELREGYSFSKECIIVWTMQRSLSLAQERGIRMNCIAPGPTETAMMPDIVSGTGQAFMDAMPKPLVGRNALPIEQAWPLAVLNSAAMNIVSGAVLFTDQCFNAAILTGQFDPMKVFTDLNS